MMFPQLEEDSFSHRIRTAMLSLRTEATETRFARLCAARTLGFGGWDRLNTLRGQYDNGRSVREQRIKFNANI